MELTTTVCNECGYLSTSSEAGDECLVCGGKMRIDYVIDKTVSCTTCKTHDGAWIYCPILNYMLDIDGFDETGELHGCNMHS